MTHLYLVGVYYLLSTNHTISEPITPVSYSAILSVTFSGLTCPPDSANEIFSFVEEQAFRDVDMRGFKNTLISAQNYYTSNRCRLRWRIESDGTAVSRTPAILLLVYQDERDALFGGRRKRRFAVEEEEDLGDSGFEVECPEGSGVSSDSLYCGELRKGLAQI